MQVQPPRQVLRKPWFPAAGRVESPLHPPLGPSVSQGGQGFLGRIFGVLGSSWHVPGLSCIRPDEPPMRLGRVKTAVFTPRRDV